MAFGGGPVSPKPLNRFP